MVRYQNKILYTCKKGVFKYDSKSDTFKKDSIYSDLMPEIKFLSAKLISDHVTNKLWSFTKNDIRYLAPGNLSNKPSIHIIPIKGSMHKGASGYENIISISDKKYLIGTSNGYLIVDLDKISTPLDFNITINTVLNNKLDDNKTFVTLLE